MSGQTENQEAAQPPVDYPLSLAGAHGRIDAYRYALARAELAISVAWPYVANVVTDPEASAWRRETAASSLSTLRSARDRITQELSVTNP